MVENLLRKKGQIPQQMNLAVSRAVVFGGPLYIASPTVPAATSLILLVASIWTFHSEQSTLVTSPRLNTNLHTQQNESSNRAGSPVSPPNSELKPAPSPR